jgi:hypothetical protein
MTMAALALALTGASEASAETRYAAPGAPHDAACTEQAPCSLLQARYLVAAGDTLRLAPGRYDGEGNLIFDVPVTLEGVRGNRPVLDVATLQLPAGSALRDVTVRGSADRVLVVRGDAERVEVTNSVPGPGTICEVHGTLANSACYTTGTAAAVAGDGALRHVTAVSGADALRATGTTTAVNSILAGTTDGDVTLDHTHTGDRDTLFPRLAAGILLPPAGAPTIDAAGPALDAELDLSGGARLAGAAPDQGALEYRPEAPVVTTGAAVPTATGATVIGTIAGAGARYHVQYGPDAGYGRRTVAVTGTGEVQVALSGLEPRTTYHYRFVAVNAAGETVGADRTFTTLAAPAVTPTPTATPTVAATPEPAPIAPAAVATPVGPAATPTPTPAARPKVTITLPTNRRCRRTRSFSVRAKIAKGGTITRVEVYVNKRRKLRVTGAKARRAIRVSGLPRGRYTLEVRVKTRDGRTERLKRSYRTCTR